MKVKKTIRIKLHNLTNIKNHLLNREYEAFQDALNGEDVDLYSATAQQVSKVKEQKKPVNEQPIRLRNDVINVKRNDKKLSTYWAKIPVYNPKKNRGDSIWCPVHIPRKDQGLVENCTYGDSELVRKNGSWFLHLVVKTEVPQQKQFNDVLAVDMGARWIAVSVALSDRSTTFYGEKVRRTREHYKQLRKKIGKKKVWKGRQVIKRLGNKEKRKVEDHLHKIANQIVEEAKNRNAYIAIGDLTGIRDNNTNKGARFNDKLHKMPYSKMTKFIEYKANWQGIPVVKVDERDTSKTCWRCGSQNTVREGQGLFRCRDCGLEDNADKNGATNIGKRALGKNIQSPLSKAGAELARPITPLETPQ